MTEKDLHIIQQIFTRPLPGKSAHALLAKNLHRVNYSIPNHARHASVMILLFPDVSGQLQIVFTQRTTTHDNDKHSGQMSFPGGKFDETDADLKFTALRETREEIGVSEDLIHILGQISPLYIPVSNFLAHPFVGYIDHQPTFEMEIREVEEIIIQPLHQLVDYIEPSITDIKLRDLHLRNVPYFDVQGKVVWGATSMILNEFLVAIRAVS